MSDITLRRIALPEFGVPTRQPTLEPAMYAARLERFRARLRTAGLTEAVIYADREHMANFAWLTGFDPRFEEALLIVPADGEPTILAGPENVGIARVCELPARCVAYPPFGLLGQDRSRTPKLAEVLREAGVGDGARVGVLGWRYFTAEESPTPDEWSEAPSYLVDALRALAGAAGRVVNANALTMDPADGLRATSEIDQIAWFEFSACQASEGIKRVLHGMRLGMTEFEAAALMRPIGVPLNCPMFLSTGSRAWFGLGSPSGKPIARGEAFTAGFGVVGALNCRAGWLVEAAAEFPAERADYVEKLAVPYFRAAQAWYETVGLGVEGGAIDAAVRQHLGAPFFNLFLPPGHLIGLEEWISTPITAGSTVPLRSGQMLQCDMIPATGAPYGTINIEDGIALLDPAGREEMSARHPDIWARIQARRDFMVGTLGYRMREEVLPLGNIPGWLPPFLLDPGTVLVRNA